MESFYRLFYSVYKRLEQLVFITECDFDAEEYTALTVSEYQFSKVSQRRSRSIEI
jgi:hypothetical protein